MNTNRLDLFELETGEKMKDNYLYNNGDYKELDDVDIYFRDNFIKDEVLLAYLKEYRVNGDRSSFVKRFLTKVFDAVNFDYRDYEDDIHYLYVKVNEELSRRYMSMFEQITPNTVSELDIQEELRKSKYKKEYSDSKFKKKLKTFGNKVGGKILYPTMLLYNLLQDNDVPTEIKGTILTSLGYFICPVDLIADVIPIVGFTDDLGALTLALNLVKSYITPDIERKTKSDINKLFT